MLLRHDAVLSVRVGASARDLEPIRSDFKEGASEAATDQAVDYRGASISIVQTRMIVSSIGRISCLPFVNAPSSTSPRRLDYGWFFFTALALSIHDRTPLAKFITMSSSR